MLHAPPKVRFKLPSLRIEQEKSAFAEGNVRWTNADMDPVPAHARKWGVLSFLAYWVSDAFNIAGWEFAGSIIAGGLTWRDALGIVALAFIIISVVISMNGAIGAIYHSPFPVLARASWGFWGSYVAIVSRLILAVFWFAIQNVNGGNSVTNMIAAIWPSFQRIPNHIPADEGITTAGMVGYTVFFLIELPIMCISPNRLRWFFAFKSIVVPVSWIAMLVWAFKSASTSQIFSSAPAKATGPAYSWSFLSSLTSVIANYATLSVNQSDFSRYSRVNYRWQVMYVVALPVMFTFIAFIGVTVSSATQAKYSLSSVPWDPNAVVSHWENRACKFFAAAALAIASIGSNISANSLSAANDFTALAPQYMNIRRGQLLCALFSWILVPWKIMSSSSSFMNFMSAYGIFLGPIAAIMLFDFWLLKARKYDSLALYQPLSIYRYTRGVNWRAIVAFLVGVIPNLPGLAASVNTKINVGVGIHPYQFGWLLGFSATTIVYLALSYAWPQRETHIERAVYPDEIYQMRGDAEVVEGVPGPKGDFEEVPEMSGRPKWVQTLDRVL